MPHSPASGASESPHQGLPFVEFVSIIAFVMALNALAVDIMLPALPEIGASLNIEVENDRQLVILSYLMGFGTAQLFFGPVIDALGRKPVLTFGLAVYTLASIAAVFAIDLEQMVAARVLQGAGCAAARVAALSVVRDCYSGRLMGKVMSLAMMVFMAVPVVAPSLGQAVLFVADWRWVFAVLLGAGLLVLVWCAVRLPETLNVQNRRPMRAGPVLDGYWIALKNPVSLGYSCGMACIFGGFIAFLAMSQQIFAEHFGLGGWFPIVFAGIAIALAFASFTNAQLVEAIGMRRLSHGAAIIYTFLGLVLYLLSYAGLDALWIVLIICCLILSCFGFIGANFNAMAIEPLGAIAGTASSVIGFISTLGGSIIGYLIGHRYDDTMQPLALGFVLCGLAAIACILYAEKGKFFQAQHQKG